MAKYAGVVFNTPLEQDFTYSLDDFPQVKRGMRIEAPFGRTKKIGIVTSVFDEYTGDFDLKPILRIIDQEPLIPPSLLELGQWMAEFYFCSLGEALFMMLPSGKRDKALPALFDEEIGSPEALELSSEQRSALHTILSGENLWSYLYGITGSGKTEVFLQAAEAQLAAGRGVIYLVPEIALSQQLSTLLHQRFKGSLAIIHSRLTPSQRLGEWKRILSGEAKVVVGARSAIFAPLPDLGLIIIDEEHEGSYKAGNNPRYHARQVAFFRSRKEKARLIMGSATPSVEAYHLMQQGGINRLDLTRRLAGGAMPELHVVDLRLSQDLISPSLHEAMEEALKKGRQVLLFLNRRGFSYTFHCKTCGEEVKCRQCSVPLTYHKSKNALICHYCGYQEPPKTVCPSCSSLDVGYYGFGTEHVEEEIAKLFPEAVLERVDTDSVQKKGSLEASLEAFRTGKTQILVGTQMIAKGLNFPGVQVVGVLLADSSLGLPDFRAGERTFSLLTQVAGRAGRFTPDGKVFIQTLRPEAPAIQLASTMQFAQFYQQELGMREVLDFPPFCRIIRFTFRSKNKGKASQEAQNCLRDLLFLDSEETEILGPAEAPLFQIAQNYRYQLMVKTREFDKVHFQIRQYISAVKPASSVYREVDIDPVSML